MLSDIISNMTNHVLCLVIGRVRLVFGCPEVIPGMEEAQRVVTGRKTAKLKNQHIFTWVWNYTIQSQSRLSDWTRDSCRFPCICAFLSVGVFYRPPTLRVGGGQPMRKRTQIERFLRCHMFESLLQTDSLSNLLAQLESGRFPQIPLAVLGCVICPFMS